MSLPTQIRPIPTAKTASLEFPVEGIPPSLEVALNGNNSSTLKSMTASGKAVEPGGLDPDAFRRLSLSTLSGLSDDGRTGRSLSHTSQPRYASHSPAPPKTWRGAFQQFWQRNRGLALVTISQFFGALMNVATRLLELEGEGMHPFQVLFARMGITMVLCCLYMWYTKVPYFPLGMREVRKLLVIRGLAGFFGIFGMYYSLLYLPLADATVITFLAPALAGYGCYLLFGEVFTRTEQAASIVSLLGVVLIARPTSFFSLGSDAPTTPVSHPNSTGLPHNISHEFPTPTSGQRLSAIALSLLGVAGAAIVFTTIRWIGRRAHPLISVNYYAIWCTIVSSLTLSLASHLPPPLNSPSLHFALPVSFRQWSMLFFLGTCGFIMQFMMTAGISHENNNRATSMVYTNMLFALLFDKWVFGTVPGVWSLLGSGLILGSAVFVAVQKGVDSERRVGTEAETGLLMDEERATLDDVEAFVDDHGEGEDLPLMEINITHHDEEREPLEETR